jgi:hypothetical protein
MPLPVLGAAIDAENVIVHLEGAETLAANASVLALVEIGSSIGSANIISSQQSWD